MKKSWIGFLLLVAGPFMSFPVDSSMGQDSAIAFVDMPQSGGPPNGEVLVPITLTLGRGTEIGSLSMTVRFPIEPITFQKIELRGVAEALGAEAKAEVTQEKDETVLQLTIATPEKDGGRSALPQGPLADLRFKIAKDTKPATVIPLTIVASNATGTKAVAGPVKLETHDGRILVSNPAVITCFFYMH